MLEFSTDNFLDNISKNWQKKAGLASVLVFLIAIVFILINYFDDNRRLVMCYLYSSIIIPAVVFIFWLINTRRLVVRGGNDLVLAVTPRIDDEEYFKLLLFINKAIEDIKEIPELNKAKIIILPPNFLPNDKSTKKYLSLNKSTVDVVLAIRVNTGNIEKEEAKFQISNFHYFFNFNSLPFEKEIFDSKIHFINEANFQNFHKDWSILSSNSFNDKIKLENNFKDMLIHAISIQYILIGKLDFALNLLERIFDKKNISIELVNDAGGKKMAKIKPSIASTFRQLELITQLCMSLALKHKIENKERTYDYLKRLEKIGHKHPYMLEQYMLTARIAYELGIISEAKSYTEKAENFDCDFIDVHFNHIFLGLLDNDWKKMSRSLKILLHKRKKITQVFEVIDFLSKERDRNENKRKEIDFLIEFYSYAFLQGQATKETLINKFEMTDFKEGRTVLSQIVQQTINVIKK